jgi:hypothetical protein
VDLWQKLGEGRELGLVDDDVRRQREPGRLHDGGRYALKTALNGRKGATRASGWRVAQAFRCVQRCFVFDTEYVRVITPLINGVIVCAGNRHGVSSLLKGKKGICSNASECCSSLQLNPSLFQKGSLGRAAG